MMGYKTPNIDRVAEEGMLFTDSYGQQSCTAGRAAFITGQSPVRTGLTKVGLPGAKLGLQAEDPTIAELLKAQGYVTGQFGKNHLGDLDEHLPSNHGFDEFYGNLYHLNAEEEPENEDYPKDPNFKKRFGPRGVIKSSADGKIQDTGPLTRKRMETADGDFVKAANTFMEKSHKADKPFFVWWNSTRMHIWTHLSPEWKNKTGLGVYADGMTEHDHHVGQLLNKLDDLGIADNTIVMYSTDNGAETFTWPDGGTTPFRSEKATTWEGGFRVPTLVRWPGKIKPGSVSNEIIAHEDWMPTLLDGYNQLPLFTGKGPSARKEMFYFTDDGDLSALRYNRWKIFFSQQEHHGFEVWKRAFTELRMPVLIDLRGDPFERAPDEAIGWPKWAIDRMFAFVPAQAYVADFLKTFKEFPPRQKPASFGVDDALKSLQDAPGPMR